MSSMTMQCQASADSFFQIENSDSIKKRNDTCLKEKKKKEINTGKN